MKAPQVNGSQVRNLTLDELNVHHLGYAIRGVASALEWATDPDSIPNESTLQGMAIELSYAAVILADLNQSLIEAFERTVTTSKASADEGSST